MSDTLTVQEQLGAAVHQNSALSKTGLLERVFSRAFNGLVYPQIWEDPDVDMAALEIGPDKHLVCIASGGCNLASYLTKGPASITAVDLSPAHVALNRMKLKAARHLPDHESFYGLFGHANLRGNSDLFDRHIAPHCDDATRAYWTERRGVFGRRIDMFEDGFYRSGMLGRFIGSAILRVFSPGKILAFNAAGAILLIAISASTSGTLAGYTLLAVGLMNSIMFPTIFSLACEKLGPRAADGSGIINVAIFGGAVVPLAFGALADLSGSLAFALILPAICYAIIASFGLFARRPA